MCLPSKYSFCVQLCTYEVIAAALQLFRNEVLDPLHVLSLQKLMDYFCCLAERASAAVKLSVR